VRAHALAWCRDDPGPAAAARRAAALVPGGPDALFLAALGPGARPRDVDRALDLLATAPRDLRAEAADALLRVYPGLPPAVRDAVAQAGAGAGLDQRRDAIDGLHRAVAGGAGPDPALPGPAGR
jgi:hypothetical protein